MRIENLASLVRGEVLNKPAISFIDGVSFVLDRIKEGNLFFAKNKKEAKEALKKGAYAIVSTEKIKEKEAAIIVVKDIFEAIIRFIRYKIISNGIKLILVDKMSAFLIEDEKSLVFDLERLDFNKKFFLFWDKDFLEKFELDYIQINEDRVEVKGKSLLKNDFLVGSEVFFNVPLPYFFSISFAKYVKFCKKFNKEIELKRVKNHFEPIFLDKDNFLASENNYSKIAFIEVDKDLFEFEKRFLVKDFKYLKVSIGKITNDFDLALFNERIEFPKRAEQNSLF